MASSQLIGSNFGSIPYPFSRFVLLRGVVTRLGLYKLKMADIPFAQTLPWLFGFSGSPSTFTILPLTLYARVPQKLKQISQLLLIHTSSTTVSVPLIRPLSYRKRVLVSSIKSIRVCAI